MRTVLHCVVFLDVLVIIRGYIDGLVQGCSNSIANALELLQSCTKPSIFGESLHDYFADTGAIVWYEI